MTPNWNNLNLFDFWPLYNHRLDKEVKMNTFRCLTLTNTLAVSVCCEGCLNLTPHWNTFELFWPLTPLTTGRTKRSPWTLFDAWHWPTHWQSQFVVKDYLKSDLSTVTPNDPKMTSKEPLAKISSSKFHQSKLNYIDKEAFWVYLINDPLHDLWSQIPKHPYCIPTRWWLYSSITKIHQGIFEKKHFEIVDRQIDRYTETPIGMP